MQSPRNCQEDEAKFFHISRIRRKFLAKLSPKGRPFGDNFRWFSQALGLRIRFMSLLGTWMTFTRSLPSMSFWILLSAVTTARTASCSLSVGMVAVV